jgi:GNAT superfamily N-acetyltransferase
MCLKLAPRSAPALPDLAGLGLKVVPVSHEMPFCGREPQDRAEYSLWGNNGGAPYMGYVLVTADELLQGHISWYPLRQRGHAAIAGFWVAPPLRQLGLGRYLLDRTLYDLIHAPPPWGGYESVEVQTHLVQHALAAALYERRGFVTDTAWVNLVKECTVRGTTSIGMQP